MENANELGKYIDQDLCQNLFNLEALPGSCGVCCRYRLPLGYSRDKSPATKTTAQMTFATPAEAGQALQAAAKNDDEKTLVVNPRPQVRANPSSGDPAEDKAALQSFVSKYDQMNRWVAMTDGGQVLNIGADNYPFPIPLAQDAAARWYFNTPAGEDEILARRIGRNELLAMDTCSAIANAEELYFASAARYTPKIISTSGTQDGLYWETPAPSPLDKLSDFAPDAVSSARFHGRSGTRWLFVSGAHGAGKRG